MSHKRHGSSRLVTAILGSIALAILGTFASGAQAEGQVVIYTSLDRQFSEPILQDFQRETGIRVLPVYDTEATKTVGLVNRLLAERNAPRCDVFWNNEIVRTIQLSKEGLTAEYRSPSAETIPATMKDPAGHWAGFAARARVIMVNTELLPDPATHPTKVADLMDPLWKGRVTFAKPLFGTTNTHAAVIWSIAGEEKSKAFWNGALANGVMLAGNAQARDAAAKGEVAWCWTDTDDAYGALVDGKPVRIIYPEHDPAGPGTLLIPNTVCLIKGGPNPGQGKQLIDYLLTEAVEGRLAKSRSAQIPVRESVAPPDGIPPLREDQILAVDWQKAYESIAASSGWLQERLSQP